ncbi:nuclear transport factor 2 family protein [Smaragdicoccus niigatensis]|uniref:nuclear transport factor 2 family protein n=1 Tax=Smaragdicoccus niigatensis TaxID=359359 RepID=UPI001FE106D1|nr:nuclear transport factor 2 family protein [Smaragdicoccus niigatensis]
MTSVPTDDVLALEGRWLAAITAGDRATVDGILAQGFRHISSDGKLVDRAGEMASMTPLPFTMNPSEQIVDIVGDTAVIHGVNTLMQDGKLVGRERFTDVFVRIDGKWQALSAQETTY